MLIVDKNYKMADLVSLLRSIKEDSIMQKSYSEEYDKINPDDLDEYKALNNKTTLNEDEQIHKDQLMHSISNKMNSAINYGKFKQSVDNSKGNVIDLLDKTLTQFHHKINKQDIILLSANDKELLKEKIIDFRQYLDQLDSYLNQDNETSTNSENEVNENND